MVRTKTVWGAVLGVVLAMGCGTPAAWAASAEEVLAQRCLNCHDVAPDGSIHRISAIRKSPEGWAMTLTRMSIWHGVKLSEPEREVLVHYLANTQGLAPEEAQPYRYALERRPDHVEDGEDATLMTMCARCHTYARVALQRRDTPEWLKLMHTHVGQYPTLEYQASARDKNWWDIATTETAQTLGEKYPSLTPAWLAWAMAPKKSPEGVWRVVMHRPGVGDIEGRVSVAWDGEGFAVVYNLTRPDGSLLYGTGRSVVYTGYEWRGSADLDGEAIREVYALSPDGDSFTGRWFLDAADEVGADVRAVRVGDMPQLLAVLPSHLKAGEKATVKVVGSGLVGPTGAVPVDLGEGVKVTKVLRAEYDNLVVEAEAAADAPAGARTVGVGMARGDGLFTVYGKLDGIRVEPAFTIARVGGDGGKTAPVAARFEAVGFLNGPDGEAGTEDDVRVGVFPATWSVDNFNEAAAEMKDAEHAGTMKPDGLFVPAPAGLNPKRKYQTNNAGDLKVKATVGEGDARLEGEGRLIVTVQRWVDPPIR